MPLSDRFYLLDFAIQLLHFLDSASVIISSTNGINPVPDIGAKTQPSTASVTTDDCRKSVSFSSNTRQIIRQLLEVELLLVP